jgi:hypothetical protein
MVTRTAANMTAAGPGFVKTLVELSMPSNPHTVRLGAARAGLELGMRAREVASLETRMAAMEQQLATFSASPEEAP